MAAGYFNYKRRISSEVQIGSLKMGGLNPIRIQTMANTNTNDIDKSVEQCITVVNAGCELMRYTTQGMKEVESLRKIHTKLRQDNLNIPLVADVHFNNNIADLAAQYVEKVRINPGNFAGMRKCKIFNEEDDTNEYELLKSKFVQFLHICKQSNTAIRIGVNHGSLSERIMNTYGDTPSGMVASCMELLRICRQEDFKDVVISLKASNTVFMVFAVRLLVKEMDKEEINFPIHLGVTEAGEGEDGRIKSAVGIGALLADGIGDTIRVSLSENPENEIPVAKKLASYFEQRNYAEQVNLNGIVVDLNLEYSKRKSKAVKNIGGNNLPVVFLSGNIESLTSPDYYTKENKCMDNQHEYPVYNVHEINILQNDKPVLAFLRMTYEELSEPILKFLRTSKNIVVLLYSNHIHPIGEYRAFFYKLNESQCEVPVVLCREYKEEHLEDLQIKASADFGVMFIDGLADGIFIDNTGSISSKDINSLSFGILQAARARITKTEYISCPGCGRTLFDLHKAVAEVKKATVSFSGLKIAVMGCIVNGPGEMADADYGYVGAGHGKISLYHKKNCVESNIPEKEALKKLVDLIRKNETEQALNI